MLGKFQKSCLRLEVEASAEVLRESLLHTNKLSQWLSHQRFSPGLPDKLYTGLIFTSWVGIIPIQHQVEIANDNCLRLLLSQAIDGYHEWYWGDGWVQSRIEGVSMLPLNLGQTFSLLKLREFLDNLN